MARSSWAILALVLAVPARALEDGWTHDVDVSTGFGSGTVTAALGEVSAFGLFGGRLFGRTRPVNSGGIQTEASPPTRNLLALGRKDQGTLDSEFFVAWWFDERLAIRAGASHVETEVTA